MTKSAEPELCHCADGENHLLVAERGKCLIECGAEIAPKHYLCRPCALGNHTGQSCRQYVPEFPRHLIKTCARCGFDSALHEVGSDGRAN